MQNLESIQRLFKAGWRDVEEFRNEYRNLSNDGASLANGLVNLVFEEQYSHLRIPFEKSNLNRYADDASLWGKNVLRFRNIKQVYRTKVAGRKVAQLNKLIQVVNLMV